MLWETQDDSKFWWMIEEMMFLYLTSSRNHGSTRRIMFSLFDFVRLTVHRVWFRIFCNNGRKRTREKFTTKGITSKMSNALQVRHTDVLCCQLNGTSRLFPFATDLNDNLQQGLVPKWNCPVLTKCSCETAQELSELYVRHQMCAAVTATDPRDLRPDPLSLQVIEEENIEPKLTPEATALLMPINKIHVLFWTLDFGRPSALMWSFAGTKCWPHS